MNPNDMSLEELYSWAVSKGILPPNRTYIRNGSEKEYENDKETNGNRNQ